MDISIICSELTLNSVKKSNFRGALQSCPDAAIFLFNHEDTIQKVDYEETEHFIVSKYFFSNYPSYRDEFLEDN